MKPETYLITIDDSLALPIYKQIVQSIYDGISKGKLKQGDLLPSVNQVAAEFSLARGSVFMAYNEMRAAGVIDSIPGKGYFVTSSQIRQTQNIFLLFSTFTPYKEVLYNSLVSNLNGKCNVDIYFHHHNIKVFETLIREQAAYYNTFVIMPVIHEKTLDILNLLKEKKTYLLDVGLNEYGKFYPGICQNFENDIYQVFSSNADLFQKYTNLILEFPANNKTDGILKGFKKFTKQKGIPTKVYESGQKHEINKGDCYVVIDDKDLVKIIKQANANGWKLGKDIGIISYNETELKSVMANGITTITTDFAYMGKRVAEMILEGETVMEENPFLLIKRKSV